LELIIIRKTFTALLELVKQSYPFKQSYPY